MPRKSPMPGAWYTPSERKSSRREKSPGRKKSPGRERSPRHTTRHTSSDMDYTVTRLGDKKETGDSTLTDAPPLYDELSKTRIGKKTRHYSSPLYEDFINNAHGSKFHRDLPFKETKGKGLIYDTAGEPPSLKGFNKVKKLGSGTYGEVWKYVSPTEEIAVKIQKLNVDRNNVSKAVKYIKQYIDEFYMIKKMEFAGYETHLLHPHAIYFTHNAGSDFRAWILMPMMKCSLSDLLRSSSWPGIQRSKVWKLIQQLTTALDSLHRNNILHRDIKPDNVLVSASGQLYLSDFGMLCEMTTPKTCDAYGTPMYLDPYSMYSHHASKESDQYSMAIVFLEMLIEPHHSKVVDKALSRLAKNFMISTRSGGLYLNSNVFSSIQASKKVQRDAHNVLTVMEASINPSLFNSTKSIEAMMTLIHPEPAKRIAWSDFEKFVVYMAGSP
jgi:serine/threonine protein kinase